MLADLATAATQGYFEATTLIVQALILLGYIIGLFFVRRWMRHMDDRDALHDKRIGEHKDALHRVERELHGRIADHREEVARDYARRDEVVQVANTIQARFEHFERSLIDKLSKVLDR